MKSRLFIAFFILIGFIAFSQTSSIDLTFTGVDTTTHIQVDSIKVLNRTQGGDTVLYWPDTVLSISYVGIHGSGQQVSDFIVYQNYPNPVTDQTIITLYIPEKDKVTIMIMDLLGHEFIKKERVLDRGSHSFRFSPGSSNLYFFNARWQGRSSSIKILRIVSGSINSGLLEYVGGTDCSPQFKAMEDVREFTYSFGDELLYIGFAGALQSGINDNPEDSQTYTFQFATNIPCPGTPTVTYEGQVYNTIQIYSQCWFKENLDVGIMIPGTIEQSNNGIKEKYCYNDEPDSCDKYGGLYQWDEIMQYTTMEGIQGICPSGWHLPADEDWKILEGATDSQYKIGDPAWDSAQWRGFDAGLNLKADWGWMSNGNGFDLYDFSALPAGYRRETGSFVGVPGVCYFWSSSEYSSYSSVERLLSFDDDRINIFSRHKTDGLGIRCLRDEVFIEPIELTFTGVNDSTYVQMGWVRLINRSKDIYKEVFWPDTTIVIPEDLYYETGDTLIAIGHYNYLESGILLFPEESQTVTFQFAYDIPCPGTPTVTYEGQVYNTVQIFSQCWLKENLNVGTVIPGTDEMTDNGLIEKYCINDNADSCAVQGGLYQWQELMQYSTLQGVQGICPPGWHVPADEEWKILEGAVDGAYGIGSSEWDNHGLRGHDVGLHLKTTSGWYEDGNGTDQYGFSGRPTGHRDGIWGGVGNSNRYADWWTSTRNPAEENWVRHLSYNNDESFRTAYTNSWGFQVRCVKNE